MTMKICQIVALLLHLWATFANSQQQPEFAPIVELKNGKIRGIIQQVDDNPQKVYLYQGIRYGQARRFAKPQPADSWTGIYNATVWRNACPQQFTVPFVPPVITDQLSEDCLFLNVWTPETSSQKKNKAVMVFIHGGFFTGGSIFATNIDGKYLSSQGDLVIVAINYRLGAFGFLYGGTEDAPGNLGLHDQILALKWVQENIFYFGGDSNSVTLFGQSAGSTSVGLLIVSPLASGLFHRAIMQSAGPLSDIASVSKESSLNVTQDLIKNAQCAQSDNIDEQIACLRTKNYTQILDGLKDTIILSHFAPIFGDKLLPLKPVEALRSSKIANANIDLIYGVVSNEGSLFVTGIVPSLINQQNLTLTLAKQGIEDMFSNRYNVSKVKEISDFYGKRLVNDTQDGLRDIISEAWGDKNLVCPTISFGQALARHSRAHKFYSYRLVLPSNQLNGCTGWMAVCHTDDLTYLMMQQQIRNDSERLLLGKQMVKAWTSFAKTGVPTRIGTTRWEKAVGVAGSYATKFIALDGVENKMVDNYYVGSCDHLWRLTD